MKYKIVFYIAHLKFLNGLILLLFAFSCFESQDKVMPAERSLTESVYSSVTIQPDSLYQVYAIVAGILDNNVVEEGDVVLQGDPIIEIINSTPELNAKNAKLTLQLAKENFSGSSAILSSIKEEIIAAKLKYSNDSTDYFRQKSLWKQKIGSQSAYDTKKLKYQLASNHLKLLQSKYNRTKHELETAVQQAQNNYETALINSKDFTITSKIEGKVYALYKEPGEIVTTAQPLASIGSASNFVIEMLVDEVDIVRISKNQKVLIHLDAYSEEIFTGYVSKIYPKKDERNQTFKIEAIFDTPPQLLYPGLSGEANILVAQKDTALTIPKTYLIDNNKVRTDNGLTTVTTGLQNMEHIEILSGITKNTTIYKPQ